MYGVKTGGFDSAQEASHYFDGVADGLKLFAWWRDGTQYVGTTGTTLAEALDQLEMHRRQVEDMRQSRDAERTATTENEAALAAGKGKKGGKAK